MKNGILTALVLLIAAAGLAQAEDLHGTIDVTYGTKYLWRGFNVFGEKSAIHPSVDLDLFGSGFGFNVIGHRANSSGYELTERWDYTLYYQGQAFEGESYAMNYRLGYTYFNYPELSSHTNSTPTPPLSNGSIDIHEFHGIFSFPQILCVEGLVPTYVLVKLMPVNSDTIVGTNAAGTSSGFAHIFMLDYGIPFNCPLTGGEQTLNLHSEVVFNDGICPHGGFNVDHDWSNAVFGLSTTYDLGSSLFLTPQMLYQMSMDDSVNRDDELWATMSLSYKF